MKKFILLGIGLCISVFSLALTVVSTAGGLATAITSAGGTLSTVTDLTVSGVIDARDFKTMKLSMPALQNVDLSNCTIATYTGSGGTSVTGTYLANTVPGYGFSHHSQLQSIIIPEGVTSLEESCFLSCTSLAEVTNPSTLVSIKSSAFEKCSSLVEINLPSRLKEMRNKVFLGCSSLDSIIIPDSVNYLGTNFIQSCSNLTYFRLPPNCNQLKRTFYSACTKLEEAAIPLKTDTIFDHMFTDCSSLKSFILPYGVKYIDNNAFRNCISAKFLILPSTVTGIKFRMLNESPNIEYVKLYNPIPVDISTEEYMFANNFILYVPKGSKAAYEAAAIWKTKTIVEFDTTMSKTINLTAGQLSTVLTQEEKLGITRLTLSGTMNAEDFRFIRDSIPYISFLDLSDVEIISYDGNNGTLLRAASATYTTNKLPEYAFENRRSLRTIILPKSLQAIGNYAFYGCTNLDSLKTHNSAPIDLSSSVDIFYSVNKTNCTLSIPSGSLSSYKAAPIWKDFLDTEESISTALGHTSSNNLKVFVDNNKLTVSGFNPGETVVIYNLNGSTIYNQQSSTDKMSLNLPAHGVYVVKVGEESVKLVY